jgi:hypothetical protein
MKRRRVITPCLGHIILHLVRLVSLAFIRKVANVWIALLVSSVLKLELWSQLFVVVEDSALMLLRCQ